MPTIDREQLKTYLEEVFRASVNVLDFETLGKAECGDPKVYGYGVPLRVNFETNGEHRAAVLHTIRPGGFGHEHMADRAQELIWEHGAFNRLPRHVRSYDVFGFQSRGCLIPVGNVNEFGLLTEYVDGESYAHDLERILETGLVSKDDLTRTDALCDYLVEIHAKPGDDPGLYVRRIRELVGHGQCIMGIIDSYSEHPVIPSNLLHGIERLCIEWRWRLKKYTHRLRQVHGDFHPWNILFRSGTDFSVLDRSRGEYGDPADDVTSLSLNYVFFSLQRSGELADGFATLFRNLWNRYLAKTLDHEMLEVAAPFFAFRGLVMASPLWYPGLSDEVRRRLLKFVVNVLESDCFDPRKAQQYCAD